MAATGHEFAETAALLAVMNEDDERLTELLDGMLPGELAALARQCESLSWLCRLQIRTNPRTGQEG